MESMKHILGPVTKLTLVTSRCRDFIAALNLIGHNNNKNTNHNTVGLQQ